MGEDEVRDIEEEINRAINSDDDQEVLRGYLDARAYWMDEARYSMFDNRVRPELTITSDNISFTTSHGTSVINTESMGDPIQRLYEHMLPIDKEDLIQEFNKKCENCNREECIVINCFIDHIFDNYNVRRK